MEDDRKFLTNTDPKTQPICSQCYNRAICKYRSDMENLEAKLEILADMTDFKNPEFATITISCKYRQANNYKCTNTFGG